MRIINQKKTNLLTRRNLLLVVFTTLFFLIVVFLQSLNHINNYYDFLDQNCSGKIDKIVGSSVGTSVYLETEQVILFSPESLTNCGFFHSCFSKGDSINKKQGENFVSMIRQGDQNVIVVKNNNVYRKRWLYFNDKSFTLIWVSFVIIVFLVSIVFSYYFFKANDYT